MESAYMFDHLADNELDPGHGLSPAEELALALALLSCGYAAACEAAHQKGRGTSSLLVLRRFFGSCIDASAGQFLDALLERRDLASTDEALSMTSLKAGSLGRLAAEFGASLATDEPGIIKLFGDFGFNVFTYAQLIDDLRDTCPEDPSHGDFVRQKKTLPVVFFNHSLLQCVGVKGNGGRRVNSGENSLDIGREFEASGARAFSAIVGEAFLNRAKTSLADLRRCVAEVRHLEEFLDSVVASSMEFVSVS